MAVALRDEKGPMIIISQRRHDGTYSAVIRASELKKGQAHVNALLDEAKTKADAEAATMARAGKT